MRTRRTILILALVAATLAAVVAVAVAGGTGAAAPVAPADSPAGADRFGVFRRPADDLPPAIRAQLMPATAGTGVDFDAARAVAAAGTGAVWAIPGPDQICLAQPDPIDGFAINCASIDAALAGRLWVGLNGLPGQAAGDVRLAILVPDGVPAVTAVAGDGSTETIAVTDNVAFADLADSQSIRYAVGDVQHTITVPGTPPALVDDSR
jgi:hypothetical protein